MSFYTQWSVQIRPLRDWNSNWILLMNYPVLSSNQTVAGLKYPSQHNTRDRVSCSNQTVAGLKSASCPHILHLISCSNQTVAGLKYHRWLSTPQLTPKFKSDRCGIEMNSHSVMSYQLERVQIRPLRDWNLSLRLLPNNPHIVQIRPLRDWNVIGHINWIIG